MTDLNTHRERNPRPSRAGFFNFEGADMIHRILTGGMITVFLFNFAVSATAQSKTDKARLSLFDAVERALGYFPSIRASEAVRGEAREAVGEAEASLFPSLNLNSSATRFQKPMVVTPIHGFTPGQLPTFDDTLIQGGVGLSYTLFDGGGRRARIRLARSNTGTAEADLGTARLALIADVADAYLETLSRRQILEAHDHRIDALKSELSRARQQFDAGRAARIEVLRVEAALANADADRVRDAQALDRAERDLARLIGTSAEEIRAAQLASVALIDHLLPDRESLEAQALRSSPVVAQARSRLASAEAGLAVARSGLWPELSLKGNYNYFGSGQGNYEAEWQSGIQLSYSIFEGGARSKAISRADEVKQSAREQLNLAEIQMNREIDRASSAVLEARARVDSLLTAVARFEEVARIEKLLLETGAGTETDFLNAEADLLTARANLVEARNGEISARVELARVTGLLSLPWLSQTVGDRS
jgi:outer membrane protein